MVQTKIVGRHADKVKASVACALEGLFDGATIMVGGFGLCGNPEALIRGVVDSGCRDLRLISNNAGNLGKGLATWLQAGIVAHVTCSYVGNNEDLQQLMKQGQAGDGRVGVDIVPQGTLVERMRAAGAGVPAFYTPTGVGTVVAQGKEVREFDGVEYVLERALSADFSLLRAHRGDSFGNLRFWRTAQNFMKVMAMAAQTSIVELDTLVPNGALDPDDVHLPGVFVHRIVEVTAHEDPFEYKMNRPKPTGETDAV